MATLTSVVEPNYRAENEQLKVLLKACLMRMGVGFGGHRTFTNMDLSSASEATLTFMELNDPRSLRIGLSNEESQIKAAANKLNQVFADVPTPDIMKKAYKQAFGVAL